MNWSLFRIIVGVAGWVEVGLGMVAADALLVTTGLVGGLWGTAEAWRLTSQVSRTPRYTMPDEVAHAALQNAEAGWTHYQAVQHAQGNGGRRTPQDAPQG